MSDLEEIFQDRQEMYDDYTNALFEVLSENVLAASYEVLKLNPENTMWQEVQLVDNVVLLVCIVIYHSGDTVVLEHGESLVLTDETAKEYQRIIRIGVPVQLAVTGTQEDVVKFLQESGNSPHRHAASTTVGDTVATIDGFSKEGLTEEQIKQLALFNAARSKGKAN